MNFIAIDFETANEKRHSPCSLGITVVENNKIVEEKYWLIKPKELRFEPINIWIHGIKEEDVLDKMEFDEIWKEVHPYFENNLIVAHNASFDISVLRNTLDLYNIPYPNFDYCCTMLMSKNFFNYLDNAKLNTVNNHLRYKFNHHNASADATACANILLKVVEELDVNNIDNLLSLVGLKIGKVFDNKYIPCSNIGSTLTSIRKQNHNTLCLNSICYENDTYFKDKVVVFTGPLSSMPRHKATTLINRFGGSVGSSVTKKTNILISKVRNINSLTSFQQSTKMRKALELYNTGQNIEFLHEDDFLKLVNYK